MHHRHVLFYSNYCMYSKEVIDAIFGKNLRHLFVLVCVDKRGQELPEFVDRVPLVFTVDRRILTDSAVKAFIENIALLLTGTYSCSASENRPEAASELAPGHVRTADQGPEQPEDDVSAWSVTEMGARSISDRFSFLEGNDTLIYSHNFVDINMPSQSIDAPPDESGGSGKGSKQGGRSLESLQAQRDNDMKSFMPPRQPVA